jgi:hypothetical protein
MPSRWPKCSEARNRSTSCRSLTARAPAVLERDLLSSALAKRRHEPGLPLDLLTPCRPDLMIVFVVARLTSASSASATRHGRLRHFRRREEGGGDGVQIGPLLGAATAAVSRLARRRDTEPERSRRSKSFRSKGAVSARRTSAISGECSTLARASRSSSSSVSTTRPPSAVASAPTRRRILLRPDAGAGGRSRCHRRPCRLRRGSSVAAPPG